MKPNIIFKVILAALLPATILCSCEKGQNPKVKPESPKINTVSGVVIEMENTTMTEVEDQGSSGRVFVVPVKLTGAEANGVVRVQFKVEGTGSNKAVEFVLPEGGSATDVHGDYTVTSNIVNIPSDDTNGKAGCEIATIANDVENEPKELTVTIISAEGAEINHAKDSTVVSLIDNDKPVEWLSLGDGEFYDACFTGATVYTEVQIFNHPNYVYIRTPYVWADIIEGSPSAASQMGMEADTSSAEDPNVDLDAPNGMFYDVTDPEHVMIPYFYTGLYMGYFSSVMYLQSMYSYLMEGGYTLEQAMDEDPDANLEFLGQTRIIIPGKSTIMFLPTYPEAPGDPLLMTEETGYLTMPSGVRAPQHTGQFSRPSDILKAQERAKTQTSVFLIPTKTAPRP